MGNICYQSVRMTITQSLSIMYRLVKLCKKEKLVQTKLHLLNGQVIIQSLQHVDLNLLGDLQLEMI